MTKPEDIPQRVWGLALRVWAEMRTVEHDRSVEWAHGDVEEIARAIMAAEQREREACAQIADRTSEIDPDEDNVDHSEEWEISARCMSRHIAQAIRNRENQGD